MSGSDELALLAIDTLDSEVAIVDSDGLIVYTNAAWQEFALEGGFPADPAMVGSNYLEVCESSRDDDPYAERACEDIEALLDGREEHVQLEYPCPTPEDPLSWFLMWATTFERDGELYVLVEHFDISDRKRIEREIEERNERLSTVSRVLSHDLRNPLAVALGYTELLATDPSPETVAAVRAALHRMDAIIDDAVTLSKQELDDVHVVDLHSVVEDVWTVIETDGATLERGETIAFEADRSILSSIFQNLFRNAIEHGGDGVTIGVGALEDVRGFYVEDDGPGIPADRREDAFEVGYSSGSTRDNTGLGLSIVTNAVDVHDWRIDVLESRSGGARFEITVAD
ncbi:ATP-binding protein [Natrinema longum]|uniref:histidine kinase n=1 Tax=Natrinema longum TaxID=370324 RepID=A0A8A2U4E9_9EURY|nr:ATP-binding protein [Natrinema longum]MBZ6494978.1 PAS domain-containing sensor histidine kinase [Natrinema longum]QSW83726.1 HAMP domain-containing histidine kinase [Natrinema longum]